MAGIVPVHWRNFEKFLTFIGCLLIRERGDHRIYNRQGLKRPIVIPKDTAIPVFIIRNNLRLLSISPVEYLEIIKGL